MHYLVALLGTLAMDTELQFLDTLAELLEQSAGANLSVGQRARLPLFSCWLNNYFSPSELLMMQKYIF